MQMLDKVFVSLLRYSCLGLYRGRQLMAISLLRRCARRGVRGFARDEDGNAMVEFAILAPMFFAAVLTVFDVGIMFGENVMLDTAAHDGARALRTGFIFENADEGDIAEQRRLFEEAACANIVLIDCADISYSVANYVDFQNAATDPRFGDDGRVIVNDDGSITNPAFSIGQGTEVIVLTMTTRYDYFTPFLGPLSGQSTAGFDNQNPAVLTSTLVFRNEPF